MYNFSLSKEVMEAISWKYIHGLRRFSETNEFVGRSDKISYFETMTNIF